MTRTLIYMKLFGRRKCVIFLLCLLIISVVWYPNTWSSAISKKMPLLSEEQNLEHFRRSRNLAYYMDNIHLLIRPSITLCSKDQEVPLVILVSSAPENFRLRQAARKTWAKFQPTYFVMGLSANNVATQLDVNRHEADLYGDMIVFDFHDHYQNLTLKTALMMHWTIRYCSQVRFVLKTDDTALINPWALDDLLKGIHDANFLIGHKYVNRPVERNEFHKSYMPQWIYHMDIVPLYLDGCGYIISGKDLPKIFKKAYEVPLANSENIYFTYLVASKSLGLNLQHDRSISPKRPWLSFACAYWNRALTHGYSPEGMLSGWSKIESMVDRNNTQCGLLSLLLDNDLFFY